MKRILETLKILISKITKTLELDDDEKNDIINKLRNVFGIMEKHFWKDEPNKKTKKPSSTKGRGPGLPRYHPT